MWGYGDAPAVLTGDGLRRSPYGGRRLKVGLLGGGKKVRKKLFDDNLLSNFAVMSRLGAHIGNYRTLLAYRKAEVIYDLTFFFCEKFLYRGDRTIDQMVQAARSGKQNIIEGMEAAVTSRETLLKLLNVARASLHELLADYEDYLRVRSLRLWESNSAEVKAMRSLGSQHSESKPFLDIAQSRSDEVVANMVIVLLHQADFLLSNYIEKQYADFVKEGGFREKLMHDRLSFRNKK